MKNFYEIKHNLITYILCDNPISKKYRLNKLEKMLYPIDFEYIKKLIEYQRIDKVRTLTDTKEKYINKEYDYFLKVLKANFKEEDLKNLYYNIEWVKFTIKRYRLGEFILGKITYGQYDVKSNKLYFSKKDRDLYSYHELLHLSSTDTTLNNHSTGFALDVDNGVIGHGLNEGYTEYLSNKYFYKLNDDDDFYYLEQNVAENLEMIVGKEKMQSLYLNSDFFGLFKELEKYYTPEEIEKFIINLDLVNYYGFKNYVGKEESNKINKLMEDVICFLVKGYSKILQKQNNTVEENKKLLIYFVRKIDICYDEYSHYDYDIIRINNVIRDILGKESMLDESILKKEESCYNV